MVDGYTIKNKLYIFIGNLVHRYFTKKKKKKQINSLEDLTFGIVFILFWEEEKASNI